MTPETIGRAEAALNAGVRFAASADRSFTDFCLSPTGNDGAARRAFLADANAAIRHLQAAVEAMADA